MAKSVFLILGQRLISVEMERVASRAGVRFGGTRRETLSMNQKASRLMVLGMVILGSLFCIQGSQMAGSAAEAGGISGTGGLSGKVKALKPFKAARVYAKNVDKNILFMVYTSEGQFRAVNLLPGNYQVTVQEKGFTSPMQTVRVRAGRTSTLDFSLNVEATNDDVLAVSYDAMYPPGRG